MDISLYSQSQSLLAQVAAQCTAGKAHGFMSSSIYDTAWVSMIQKPGDSKSWLFPECFNFVLQNQMSDGAWTSYASEIDGILNTAAALLAVIKHLKESPDNEDLMLRSQKAESALTRMLRSWDVGATDQVGFEILVVKHLSLLEDEGIVFDYPGLASLRAIHNAKLAKLPVYKAPSTLHHSLEALIGRIDFDKTKCQRGDNGSMFNSPSSTAAYLMNSSTWDTMAESYLEDALMYSTGKRDGAVASAWPTTVFEVSWVTTILAEAGAPIGVVESSAISKFLEGALTAHNGIVGFAPSILPDADDTAKTIMALRYLGRSADVAPLLEAFDADDHFKTYQGERNPSFSANCNILTCLLMLDDPAPYVSQITKATKFLCKQAFSGDVREKWHTHELYWMMLLSQAFVRIWHHMKIEAGSLRDGLFSREPQLRQYIPMISLHILVKTLGSQETNGSWGSICEVTAYAVLTLSSLAQIPWVQELHDDRIIASINRGLSFLKLHRTQWDKGHYLWVEKVTYSSDILSEAYCLAAAMGPATLTYQSKIPHAFSLPEKLAAGVKKAMDITKGTPLLAHTEPQILQEAELVAVYALCYLQQKHVEIFPQPEGGKRDHKYQIFTPVIWAVCNATHGNAISLSAMCEMVTFSTLIYQVDEYMETVIEKVFKKHLPVVARLIAQLCQDISITSDGNYPDGGEATSSSYGLVNGESVALEEAKYVFSRFIRYVLKHQAVLASHKSVQQRLAYELEIFLTAHVTQAMDNQQLALQQETNATSPSTLREYLSPGRTFYSWVRSTSANHTSCPFSFVFFNCLVPKLSSRVFKTARSSYLAEDMCRHLASLCRMYNDHGSVARDRDEDNLNSVNFPEFHLGVRKGPDAEQVIKQELIGIAEYEREGLERAMSAVENDLGDSNLMDALKVLIDVTDLYGQIYVQRDLTARNK
ncbi:Ent-kaurene synthase [Daldinia vernicosa]|uniref:Ent-kaurene synthase n=1 Tax=Daldinia vernicosa TaxID=114800 RepID=UPI0020073C9D|nr:Ent-kaurene synthase [Daldinia vernicosa]KAI0847854.1 Ent-kaurene synthase [Daldinia vernicosa]